MKFSIYGLISGLNGELRYVGQTTQSLMDRLNGHLREPKKLNTHKNNWIRAEKALGLKPDIILIQELFNRDDLNKAEIYWIKFFRENGCLLTNITNGGDGVFGYTKFSKEKELEICQYYLDGYTLEETAKNFGGSLAGVFKILKRNGYKSRGNLESKNGLMGERAIEVINLYENGLSSRKIAKIVNSSRSSIIRLIKTFGIKPRNNAQYKFIKMKLSNSNLLREKV